MNTLTASIAPMDFFEAKEESQRRARLFLVFFGLCVVAVVAAMTLYAALLSLYGVHHSLSADAQQTFVQSDIISALAEVPPAVYIASSSTTFAIIVVSALVQMRRLRAGGTALAARLQARAITDDGSVSDAERRLLNVVDEMSIAASWPPPAVYVLDQEPAINGLAAARGESDAVVVLTRGALDRLQRDELQGVVAFLMGQIGNGDVRLNIRLLGWLAGITVIGDAGVHLMKTPSLAFRGKGDEVSDLGKGVFALGLFFALIGAGIAAAGYVGLALARWMRALASRQRAFLSDATAVQFTRNPTAVADALRRVAASGGGRLVGPYRAEVSHMLFVPGEKSWCVATHPSIKRRIARIEPRPG